MSLRQPTTAFDLWFPNELWIAAGKVIRARGLTTLSELTRAALIETDTLPEGCPFGGLKKRVKLYLPDTGNLKVEGLALAAKIDKAEACRRIIGEYVLKKLKEIQNAKTEK